jgi:AraC-like DNA-binding protein
MDKIVEYINKNIETASLTGVAEVFRISPSHLSRLFKESLGVNFIEYISGVKLSKAEYMLKNEPSTGINEIAALVGFEDSSYFARKFKAKYGLSPSMYRRACTGIEKQ